MGFIDFSTGDVLTANQMDTVLRQSVMRFADATERDTAIGTALAEGMLAYLDDTNEVLKYDGSSWIDISGDISAVTAGTALTGGGTSGNVTLDVDTSVVQPNVITTQGDLVIGDGSGEASRIAIGSADTVLTSNGTTATWAAAGGGGGFNTITEVTSSNASYNVSGISGVARITLIGGGGGGCQDVSGTPGSDGGDTSIVISGSTTTAQGGNGGSTVYTFTPNYAYGSFNGGSGAHAGQTTDGSNGNGGEIKIIYSDLTAISTVNITVGAGGAKSGSVANGFRGVVILEYTV